MEGTSGPQSLGRRRCLNVTHVTRGGTTSRTTFAEQRHLKMRIAMQVFQNMLRMKVTSDTFNHLFSRGAILSKTLKGTHTKIGADPLAEAWITGESMHRMSANQAQSQGCRKGLRLKDAHKPASPSQGEWHRPVEQGVLWEHQLLFE